MGIIDGLFGSNNSYAKKTSNPDIKNSAESSTPTPIFKTQRFTHEGNPKMELVADNVATFEINDKEEIADLHIWKNRINNIFGAVSQSIKTDVSKYCPPPDSVEIHFISRNNTDQTNTSEDNKPNLAQNTENESIIVREPRWNFQDMYIESKVLDEINRTLLIAKYREKLFDEWKLGNGQQIGRAVVFNFYGPSGTGKSMTGEAIAAELGKKVYAVNYSELESKYVGETPKNIVAAFRKAQADNAVLIFDEADSFLGKRLTNVTQSADYGVNITRSVMLLELEKFDGVVIFTTNLVSNYDEAFKRRILTSIKFELPNEYARRKIWEIYLNRGLPLADEVTTEILANRYDNISGADIKDMLLHAAVSALYRNENNPAITLADFDIAYKMIMSRRAGSQSEFKVTHETISVEQFELETQSAEGGK